MLLGNKWRVQRVLLAFVDDIYEDLELWSLGIKDDLENAGAIWVDEPVARDGNLISSRTPKDLAPFAKAMVDFLNAN